MALSELEGHLSGKAYAKPLLDQSQAQKRRPDEMKANIHTLPDDVPARLEHGCLLLPIGNLTDDLAEAGRSWRRRAGSGRALAHQEAPSGRPREWELRASDRLPQKNLDPEGNAPGFPDDGSWSVKWEGLKPALGLDD